MMFMNKATASSLLDEYLKANGITQAAFAQLVGVSEAAVNHWVTGYARPRRKLRLAVESTTGIRAAQWDETAAVTDLERLIATQEERERVRRARHQVRMAAWMAALEGRREPSHVDDGRSSERGGG